jgi:hypothetical protein
MTWRETLTANGWEWFGDVDAPVMPPDTAVKFYNHIPKWQVRMHPADAGHVAYAFGNGFRIAFGEGATEDEAFADLLSKRVEPGGVTTAMVLGLALPAGGG